MFWLILGGGGCRHVPFKLDTVTRVAELAAEGIFMGSLDGRSGFHNLILRPESWPPFEHDGTHRGTAVAPHLLRLLTGAKALPLYY